MSTYRLDKLLAPRSVAIIGASPRKESLGRSILTNVRTGGYAGAIHVVSPMHGEIDGVTTAGSIAALPETPDLVVLATPPATVPGLVAEAAVRGVSAVIIITAGLGQGPGSFADAAERAARSHGTRLVGPNCLGVIAPAARLNVSFATRMPKAGRLAVVSQSGAVAAGIVEWAAPRAVGFSAIVSLGDSLDVDFGDCLDFFANDYASRAVLLYVESVKDARKFMSAARAAARIKPVVVIKAGRHAQGARAAATHTGALAGSDAVYDAAFRRAGLLRVYDLPELFDAAETIGRISRLRGRRLSILTNGGGIGVLAVDRLVDLGGTLAALSDDTLKRLDSVLPPTWSKANPVDIIGDADANRYGAALEALLDDPKNDAVLVVNVPTTLASATDTAKRVVGIVEAERTRRLHPKPVFATWVGGHDAALAEFRAAEIPHFTTEAGALAGFMHLVRHAEAQDMLMATPPALPTGATPNVDVARRMVAGAVAGRREWLDPVETAQLFHAYGIAITPVVSAPDPEQAARAASPILAAGGAVAVKIFSREIVHKSDVDGVRLNLTSEDAVRVAAAEVIARSRETRPDAKVLGVTVHPMIIRPKARELIAGIADDRTFGRIVVFGHGGTAVEVIDDKALTLPPLDLKMARDLIERTRVARLLKAYRNVAAANEDEVALVLVKLGRLAADIPEVREIDINPLLADRDGAIALDARVAVGPATPLFKGPGHPHFAIRPYPREWEREIALRDDMEVFVRPVRAEDERLFATFFEKVTQEDLRLRFFAPIKSFSHAFIARLTQLDYARAMAFVAIDRPTGEMLGVVRLHADANHETAEYAILLRSDVKGHGLGWNLMQLVIEYARAEGLRRIDGQVLTENRIMIEMCEQLGFVIENDPHSADMRRVTLQLRPQGTAGG
jgi:acetyltransferase